MAERETEGGQLRRNFDPTTNKDSRGYEGPRKMADMDGILDDIDALVHKGSLADSYKQTGGQ